MTGTIDLRRADTRFTTRIGWLDSRHSFSFGSHHDPENVRHGLLIVNNDDVVQPSAGFDTHHHRDMEIVTWVLSGELEHKDSEGHHGILYPGLAQRMSAGSGILHSERNPSSTDPVHFVQMWVIPDTAGITPGYEQRDVNAALDAGGLVPIASGHDHDGAISIRQRDAVLWGGRLGSRETVAVPESPHVHVFVPRGSGRFPTDDRLATGDAARLTGVSDLTFTAGDDGAEVLIWATA